MPNGGGRPALDPEPPPLDPREKDVPKSFRIPSAEGRGAMSEKLRLVNGVFKAQVDNLGAIHLGDSRISILFIEALRRSYPFREVRQGQVFRVFIEEEKAWIGKRP